MYENLTKHPLPKKHNNCETLSDVSSKILQDHFCGTNRVFQAGFCSPICESKFQKSSISEYSSSYQKSISLNFFYTIYLEKRFFQKYLDVGNTLHNCTKKLSTASLFRFTLRQSHRHLCIVI